MLLIEPQEGAVLISVLLIGDDLRGKSGNARQAALLADGLVRTGRFTVAQAGTATGVREFGPWLHPEHGGLLRVFGVSEPLDDLESLQAVEAAVRPDVEVLVGDWWLHRVHWDRTDARPRLVWWHVLEAGPDPYYLAPCYARCAAVACVSNKTEFHATGVCKAHIPHWLPRGTFYPVAPGFREDLRRGLPGVPDGKPFFVVGANARNLERKRLPDLISAWDKMNWRLEYMGLKHQAERTVLWIHTNLVEPAGRHLPAVVAQLTTAENHGRVLLDGTDWNDDDLNQFYNSLDCFVNISSREGFGIPVLEAMAAGVPTLLSCVGGLNDLGKENYEIRERADYDPVASWLAPELKSQRRAATGIALPSCLHSWLSTPMLPLQAQHLVTLECVTSGLLALALTPSEDRAAMGENARRVAKEFDGTAQIKSWVELLNSVTNGGKS